MCQANNEEWKTLNNGRKRTIKKKSEHSEKKKITNTREYWKLTSSHMRKEKKIKKEYLRRTRKLLQTNYIAEISSGE